MQAHLSGARGAKHCFVLLASALLVSSMSPCALAGGNGNPNPELGDEWWKWALSIPAAFNPTLDKTGQNVAVGQPFGDVWFLAGTSRRADLTAQRTVTVPAGKALFFPIVSYISINMNKYGDPPWSVRQEAALRKRCADWIHNVNGMDCDIDGVVQNLNTYRSRTPKGGEFYVSLPQGNIMEELFGFAVPAGMYGPAVADGIYLMVDPLPAGNHTIHFAAIRGGIPWNVTYHITVQ